ncbi:MULTISPECIES: hypothetical protein [Pseudomonas]|uniref:hypothetical protein n=1 Tax=Pseudomonas TaxID=286 RepID=UPI001C7F1FC7|nr:MULTISPECIES: hypothetical protein [Pseudomonas]MDG9928127.1 hypothetical protein [Pseudomonas sp. GD04042]MDH0484016.1 hypothetical protein [Pseudomonas sp. GD04015]MDH0607198.1 hypothetical protein [Pseudomonas sp. GD03869]MDH0896260.1 hypothetical protein [Pseudomonas sp. GD03875]MDH1064950.1 hypothetical protein [Pseudomonas sp. GD03985]
MHTVRLSLFCAAALLVNGAYATDLTGSAGAAAKTAELTVSTSMVSDTRTSALLEGFGELRRQASRAAREDGQWLRISDQGETDTATRQPSPADSTPRWVF